MFSTTVMVNSPSTSPVCHEDRLFHDLSKYARSRHATQLVPKANEFAMGQGDPLLAAAVEHWKVQALESSHRKLEIDNLEIEDKGSLRRQRSHRTKQKSLPDMSNFQQQKRGDEIHKVDHLIEHGSPFASMGMNDVVHLPDGNVVSVPCVSPKIVKQILSQKQKNNRRNHNQRRHSMPHLFGRGGGGKKRSKDQQNEDRHHGPLLSGLRMSDVVHVGDKMMLAPVGIV